MLSTLLTGTIVALSVGRTIAAGVAWAGVNVAGFDFGCEITVSLLPATFLASIQRANIGNMRPFQGGRTTAPIQWPRRSCSNEALRGQ